MKAASRKLQKYIMTRSVRMIKWQVEFRVEKSYLMCTEKNCPNIYTAIWSLLLVVIRKEV